MGNSKGLGKGLGALISLFDEDISEIEEIKYEGSPKTTQIKSVNVQPTSELGAYEIDIHLIDNNSSQPQKSFDQDAMQELEQSIMANGVLQPIIVNRVGSRYMIVAGERRWRASKNIGLKTIPALVREYSTKQIAEIALVENLMRSDLNEMEIANGIKKLMDTHSMTQEQVSKVLGKSRSSVANSLRFLSLPQEVRTLLEQKRISAGHAKILCGITDVTLCIALANRCAAGMSVRDLELHVNDKSPSAKSSGARQSLELRQFTLELTQILATRVTILGDDNRGRIIIDYNTKKDLERIYDKFK
jgi:ParB family chromosome partitioning protein